jgi:hypothetical protein
MQPRPTADRAAPLVPRRWSDTIDGIRWLPRLIDKAKMARFGTLGACLFGHSPFDAGLLRRFGVTTGEFAAIVAASHDDDAVLSALRARGFDEARVRRWSARLPASARFYIPIWDADDGYVKGGAFLAALVGAWRFVERPLMGLVRAIRKAP